MPAIPEFLSHVRGLAQGAMRLDIAYIGVVNGLFTTLHRLGEANGDALAKAAGMDRGYVSRWCDAAYAVGYLDHGEGRFRLTDVGDAFRPDAPESLMPLAIQSMLAAHMAERAAGLMRTGARPGEQVLAERETLLPWFGPMLEANFAAFFDTTIAPAVPIFAEVDARHGLAIDLGCGNGWYLRALARRYPALRGLGFDGFAENIAQAERLAAAEGLAVRLRFEVRDIRSLALAEKADLIAMNRALHHVWEGGPHDFLASVRDNLRPTGAVVIWEPNWPTSRGALRTPGGQRLAFQNLTEHVQGNHLLSAEEIVETLRAVGLDPQTYLFSEGQEAVVVARKPA